MTETEFAKRLKEAQRLDRSEGRRCGGPGGAEPEYQDPRTRGVEMEDPNDTLIEAALAESRQDPGYRFDPSRVEAAIIAGLADGDRIHVGGGLIACIDGGIAVFVETETGTETETGRSAIDNLSAAQRDRLRILKGVQAGRI